MLRGRVRLFSVFEEVVHTECQIKSRVVCIFRSPLNHTTHTHSPVPLTRSKYSGVAGAARACERFVRDKAVETDLVEVGLVKGCVPLKCRC